MNQIFSSMIDQYKHQQLRIGLVFPKQIHAWANKILPNGEIVGEVTKPYTFHYKTNKPEKDRLFCERIFGPVKSGICACRNYRVIRGEKEELKFCEQCGVESVDFWIRRYQIGYIKLACPVTHVWYFKRLPNYIVNLLDKPLKELEGMLYCDDPIGTYPNFSFSRPIAKKPTFLQLQGSFKYEIQSQKYNIPLFFTIQGFDIFRNQEISTRATAIREQLADLDLQIIIDHSLVEWKELREEGSIRNDWKDRKIRRRKDFLVRCMELAKHLLRINVEPEWMVLSLLPVLPPELRPIIQIDGGKSMSSDINELYRRVIYQNNTLTDLLTTSRSTPGELVMCQEKLVQEAADTLLDNGIHRQPIMDGHNKVYKLFLDVIEGKEGRFHETLLGKQIRHTCIPTYFSGGTNYLFCPLVCKGFNADFDGDQMVVHVPLSLEAQAKAHLLMFSHTNLLSPAIGDPISVPTQDMLMGLYILTMGNRRGICANRCNPCNPKNYQNERIDHSNYKYRKGKEPYFCSSYDALGAYRQKGIDSYIWLRWQLDQHIIASINREVSIEVQYESLGTYHEIYDHYRVVRSVKKEMLCIYI
ncbi:unnamed protein product [Victoria cruziana]